ncbi:hypothetical protein C8F01DRAFT_1178760 [Mycena amicta]|nr:hypothetical protein C8F01DRAFT_1178760 [Mycena amicta]
MAEDIEYLGISRGATRGGPFQQNGPRAVTGVVLHVEAAGEEGAHSVLLRKSDAAVVQIGRRPGGQRAVETAPGKAVSLTCAVVSRQHAKLVFSDSGQVFVVDCNSHHGTILSTANGDTKKLVPETPVQLHDGDSLTFGKAVSSSDGQGLVRPISARVAFLYAANPPFKPLVVPSPRRYGVSSESDSDSDEHSHDSDIEEVPAPPPWRDSKPEFLPPNLWIHEDFPDEDEIDDDQLDEEDDHYSDYSRCTSSMDLSSSPEPSGSIIPPAEPVVIGSWPLSRSSSPSIFTSSFPPVRLAPLSVPVVDEPESPKIPFEDASDDEIVIVKEPASTQDTTQLKNSVASLKTEVEKLHAHRRKYKLRFNDNIKVMTGKFSDLEEKTTEINHLYNFLSDKVNENVESCQQAQAQLDVIQLDMFQQRMDPTEKDGERPQEDGKAAAKVLEDLVSEMTELRDMVRKEMADELQTVRDAKDALKKLTEQALLQTESLKRKRSMDEETTIHTEVVVEPPRKRARRVGKVLARTVTATAVGAVVCWSALAFS